MLVCMWVRYFDSYQNPETVYSAFWQFKMYYLQYAIKMYRLYVNIKNYISDYISFFGKTINSYKTKCILKLYGVHINKNDILTSP